MKKKSMLLWMAALSLYLGLHNGYAAILEQGRQQPVRVFPYREEMFPDADRQAMRQGIPITSLHMLTRLLEDYFS